VTVIDGYLLVCAEAAFTFSICLVTFFFGYGGLFVSMEHMGCGVVYLFYQLSPKGNILLYLELFPGG